MYAIFQSGGHQYVAAKDDIIRMEKIDAEPHTLVTFDQVLAVREGETFKVGTPYLPEAQVTGRVLAHGRGRKIIVFKYKPKKHYKRKRGHRQEYTEVRIMDISA